MTSSGFNRRAVLLSLAGAAAGGLGRPGEAAAQAVPWSTGTEPAKLKAPVNATDSHHHVYDSRFPIAPGATIRPGDATVADYRLLQKRLGITRHVLIQPSTYGVDNRCMLDAMAQFGREARGIAVVNTSVTDAELKTLNAAGVRGIRFNLAAPGTTTLEMIDPLSKRVAALGWHIQVNMTTSEQILAARDLWNRLPCPVVFDHLAHMSEPAGVNDPCFAVVVELMHKRKAWVKLSGAYQDTKVGPPTYADSTKVAQAYVREAPERLLWGSDWPHPSERNEKPNDALLFDLLAQWAPKEATRKQILVTNPAHLFGFA